MENKIIISETDDKFYKLFTLQNGLKVLLIAPNLSFQSSARRGKSSKRKQRKGTGSRAKGNGSTLPRPFDGEQLGLLSGNLLDEKFVRRCGCDRLEKIFQFSPVERRLPSAFGDRPRQSSRWKPAKIKKKKGEDKKDDPSPKKDHGDDLEEDDYEDGGGDDSALVSAVSLCVGVGSMSEPRSVPGLAHYMEHMVFMGSEKYPVSNDFDLFLKMHGGSTNARTDYDKTHFFFDIRSDHVCEALDRFVQFFVSPLMDRKCMLAEAKIVHSEWEMNLQKERARFEQLLLGMAKPGHPINKFMWGNYESLVVTPQRQNVDVLEVLQEFRRRHYVAQNMALVVLSEYDPREMENCVRSVFQNIPRSNEVREDFSDLGDPFDTPEFRRLYKIIPVHSSHQLEITWSLPSLIKSYRKKPLHYLERLVGDYGVGSIFSALQRRHWVGHMTAGNNGSSQDMNSAVSLFRILIFLTEEGFENCKSVVTFIFQYLRMLREAGPQEYLWEELHQVDVSLFKYDEQPDAQEYTNVLCSAMLDVAPEDIVVSNFVIMEFDPKLISECLDLLTPNRMNLVLRSQEFKSSCRLEEKWFQTQYCVEDIPQEWMDEWTNPPEVTNYELKLPPKNPFMATDFAIKPTEARFMNLNEPLCSADVGRVWFMTNHEFMQPTAYYLFYFWCQSMNRTATESCLSDIYVRYITKSLKEITCPADLVNLVHGIYAFENGFILKFCGFNHKLRNLFTLYMDSMSELRIEENFFNIIRKLLINQYKNVALCPEHLCMQLHTSHLLGHAWSATQKLDSMECVTAEMLTTYMSNIFDGVYFEALFQGNVSSEEALEMSEYTATKLKLKPVHNCSYIFMTEILPGSTMISCLNRNQQDGNCVISNYYQGGLSPLKEQLLNEMLILMMEEPCFEELRTRKQLGYNVSPSTSFVYGVIGFTVTVCSQSNNFTMKQLDDHIEEFLSGFCNKIMDLGEEEFESARYLMMSLREGHDGTLGGQVAKNWAEIVSHEYLFDRDARELGALKHLKLNDLKCFCRFMLPLDQSRRRKLTIQVVGNVQQ